MSDDNGKVYVCDGCLDLPGKHIDPVDACRITVRSAGGPPNACPWQPCSKHPNWREEVRT
jgi:hypothetical protein